METRTASLSETAPAEQPYQPAPPAEYPPVSVASSRRDGLIALACATGYFALFQITPRIPVSNITIVGITTFLSLVLVLVFTVTLAGALRSGRAALISLALSALLSAPAILLPLLGPRFLSRAEWEALWSFPLMEKYGMMMSVPGLGGLAMVWFAVSIGVMLSRLVREFKILLPIGVTLALVDIYVVFGGGLVKQAESGQNPVAEIAQKVLTVPVSPRPSGGASPMLLAVGFADFLFISMFFACFTRFGIPSKRTFVVLCTLLVAYMLAVALTGLSLPALIPIAIVCIGMNLRRFRFERSEAFALLYAGIIVLAVLTALVLYARK